MSSETSAQTAAVKEEVAAAAPTAVKGEWKCPTGDHLIHKDELRKIWKECREESFWYRALPLSLGSMAVTGGLIYNGTWKASKRFGPFPKLAAAGILGFIVGRASYASSCRSKFHKLGLDGPGFGPWSGGPFGKSYQGQRCHHVSEDCKKKAQTAPAEEVKS